MAKYPFIPTFEADPEPAPTAKIVEFPRTITLQADLREARRQFDRLEQQVADNDIRSTDRQEQIRAAVAIPMLEFWRGAVRDAEVAVAMLGAEDTLNFRGQMYRAHRSINGAN
ncbi:hypothetical protein QP162_21950 [Sphingomonas aurantiaca]|uniref:hypothetical protein n=1 Tax=Sphingomonas aurantiaca TaxID=185949 RepID=UPI002FE01646